MTTLPLRLRACSDPLPVTAGWLPSPDVAAWLCEARKICEADARATVRFFPLATSARDHSVSGALITVTGAELPLDRILGARVQRLGMAAPAVLAPVHSRLEPAITAEEHRRLFPWTVHFLHPVLGLTGFDEADAITPEQLLSPPAIERRSWFAAVPGPPAPPPLKELTLVQEATLDDLMAQEAGDIASERPDMFQKPRVPGSDLLDRAAGAAGSAIGSLGAGMLRALGGGRAADKVAQWSRRLWEEVHDRRKRELNRLLDRFEKDPLEALRHAIPLTGAGSRRGAAAQPGWKLGARSMQLDARRHGSGPVDVWDIEADMRLKLERRYRESAAREASAGHHGRAAYIYGELLGDWNMAAQMLEKAGRPREAARIYLDRVRSGAQAARCLEKAGLLAEAAALYREARLHEKAGDVLAALGDDAGARVQWQLAVKGLTNPLEQARILELKLRDPDRALFVLERAWPATPQALECFMAEFALLGRHERHAEAADVLARLERNPKARLQPVNIMVNGLHAVFSRYPDSTINARAAELAMQFAGEFLARAPQGISAKSLLGLLPQFAPGDRLLSRDTARFSIGHNKPEVPLLVRTQQALRPVRIVELQKDFEWQSLASNLRTLSVAAWNRAMGGQMQYVFRSVIGHGSQPGIDLCTGMVDQICRVSHLLCGGSASPVYHFKEPCRAVWKRDDAIVDGDGACLAIGTGTDPEEFYLLGYQITGALVVNVLGCDGTVRRTRVLDLAPPDIKDRDWFVGGHGDDIWVAGPSVACCVNAKVEFQIAHLNGAVTCFAVAPPVLSSQAIAVASGEAVLLVPQGKDKPLECVNLFSGSDGAPPVATFTRDGRAVIADARGGVVYALRKSCVKAADIIVPPGSGDLIAAAPNGTQGFAFLTSSGKVLLYGE